MSNTLDRPMFLCCKLSPWFNHVMSLETSPVLHRVLHPNSGSEKIPCSRVEGASKSPFALLLCSVLYRANAVVADTTLSLKDGNSDESCGIDSKSTPINIDARTPRHLTQTQCDYNQ